MIKKLLPLIVCLLGMFVGRAQAVSIGEVAPDFVLKNFDGKEVKLSDYQGKIVVLEWFNEGCPFVQKHYGSGFMQSLQEKYTKQDVVWLTVNSTDSSHRDFLSPEETKEIVQKWGIKSSQMLADADGKVGKLYGAKTTPHMFVIADDGKLSYQGAIDDNSDAGADPKTSKNYVQQALDELRTGAVVAVKETKPYGCSVKYAS